MNIEFLNACWKYNEDNVRKVRRMISEGVDVNSVQEHGYTGLMVALLRNNTDRGPQNWYPWYPGYQTNC